MTCPALSLLSFCFAKKKVTKKKAIFFQRLRRKKNSSALLSWGIQFGPAGCDTIWLKNRNWAWLLPLENNAPFADK